MKCRVEHEDAIRVIAFLKDFEGSVEDWKKAWYTLWQYRMTFSFAHEIILQESRKNGVYVDMLVKPSYIEILKETMHDLGYREVETYDERIGFVNDETEDCFTWVRVY